MLRSGWLRFRGPILFIRCSFEPRYVAWRPSLPKVNGIGTCWNNTEFLSIFKQLPSSCQDSLHTCRPWCINYHKLMNYHKVLEVSEMITVQRASSLPCCHWDGKVPWSLSTAKQKTASVLRCFEPKPTMWYPVPGLSQDPAKLSRKRVFEIFCHLLLFLVLAAWTISTVKICKDLWSRSWSDRRRNRRRKSAARRSSPNANRSKTRKGLDGLGREGNGRG